MEHIVETSKDPESVNKISDTIFSNINKYKYKHEEYQYLNLIENILENEYGKKGEAIKCPSCKNSDCECVFFPEKK